jgi:hypothetical protein
MLNVSMDTDALLTEKPFTQFTPKSSWSVICCYKQQTFGYIKKKEAIYRAQHWRVSAVAWDNIWLLGTL